MPVSEASLIFRFAERPGTQEQGRHYKRPQDVQRRSRFGDGRFNARPAMPRHLDTPTLRRLTPP